MDLTHPYSRKLDNIDVVEHFLEVVLKSPDASDMDVLRDIIKGEAELKNYKDNEVTLVSSAHRDRKYNKESDRWRLRKQIIEELIGLPRLEKDDDITLENGGALPRTMVRSEKKAVIVIGLPASGKSTVSNDIADALGAVIVDSDYAKRKLPEYSGNVAGASLVHDESSKLIFAYDLHDKPEDFRSLVEHCKDMEYNMVIPKVGHDFYSIAKLARTFKKIYGYETHLVLVSLDKRLSTLRALDRFRKSRRYVPLSLIFDAYGHDPILTFYRLKDKILLDETFIDTFGKVSTDTPKGTPPRWLYSDEDNPARIYKKN